VSARAFAPRTLSLRFAAIRVAVHACCTPLHPSAWDIARVSQLTRTTNSETAGAVRPQLDSTAAIPSQRSRPGAETRPKHCGGDRHKTQSSGFRDLEPASTQRVHRGRRGWVKRTCCMKPGSVRAMDCMTMSSDQGAGTLVGRMLDRNGVWNGDKEF
jgi:hypothetical protein